MKSKPLKSRFSQVLTYAGSSKVARALSGTMLVAILSRLSSLAMAIVLARQLSPSGYGAFTYAVGLATIAAQISSLGWPILMSRFVPKYIVLEEWGALRGLVKSGERVLLLMSLLTSALLLYFGKSGLFDEAVSQGLALAAILMPALSFLTLRKSQLAAQRRPAQGLFFNEFLPPTAIVIISLFFINSDVSEIFYVFAGLNCMAALLASVIVYRTWPTHFYTTEAVFDFKHWMLISLPLIAAVSGKMIMSKADILMLVPLSSIEEVGYYGAVFRITYLLTFAQVVLMTVMSPLISEAIAKENFRLVSRRFYLALAAAGVFSIPLAILVFAFRTQIVETVFGVEYLPGVDALALLVFAQVAVAVNMPFTSLMIMAGRERVYGLIVSFSLVFNLFLNWYWIPVLGAEGAARATLLANSFGLLCGMYFSARVMNEYKRSMT